MSDINNTGLSKPQMKNLMKFLSDTTKIPVLGAGGGFAPIGTVSAYDGTVAPQGWLLCDGTVYNIADYPDLAAHYASHHEASNFYGGDGVTTFAVPDLRGEFIRGAGTNSHTNQGDGAGLGVHQDGTLVNTTRNSASRLAESFYGSLEPNFDFVNSGANRVLIEKSANDTVGSVVTTRPTNTSLNFIVKATVSGDANAHQYSTEEQVVGTDEDGNYIYEKTIKITTETSTTLNTWVSITPQLDELENAILRTIQISKGDASGIQVFNFLSNRIYNKTVQVYNVGVVTRLIVGSVVTIRYTKTQ